VGKGLVKSMGGRERAVAGLVRLGRGVPDCFELIGNKRGSCGGVTRSSEVVRWSLGRRKSCVVVKYFGTFWD